MRNKHLAAIVFFVFALITVNASATDREGAVEAMRVGDFAEAYCIIRPMAEDGDADAQYNIGWMYLNGYGLRINGGLALKWWQLASAQGHSDASFSIGTLYSLGEGRVAKDLDLAIDYYLLAVTDGQEDAVAVLRSMIMRNDEALRGRMDAIVNKHGAWFGSKRFVKSNKLNARVGPSSKKKILAELVKGQAVLELQKQKSWSQIVVLGDAGLGQAVWVYSPLLEDR